jgi:2-polyprenyl-6-methoxyphenol hydroxylase-like FAD-dependent oxidoreductase
MQTSVYMESSMVDLLSQTEVLIVGAGPVGLTLALALKRLGVTALIVDQHEAGLNTSRAAVIHARTLEVLEPFDVVSRLIARGVKTHMFRIHEGDRTLSEVSFASLPSTYAYALMCPQNQTEAVLMDRLTEVGLQVHRPARLTGLSLGDEAMIATLRVSADVQHTIRAQWVVGCDGAHSTVRSLTGIDFQGEDYDETFVLADVEMDWPLSRDEVSLFFSEDGLMVVAPLPEARYRIVASVSDAPKEPSQANIQALLAARGPINEPACVHQVTWSSSFRIAHRLASKVVDGRVLLCGDAAHVHSPAGGQGMNTGIQDAVALAHPLATTLLSSDHAALEDWAIRRHQVANSVVEMTDMLTRAATTKTVFARSIRNAILGLIGHVPLIERALAIRLAELNN